MLHPGCCIAHDDDNDDVLVLHTHANRPCTYVWCLYNATHALSSSHHRARRHRRRWLMSFRTNANTHAQKKRKKQMKKKKTRNTHSQSVALRRSFAGFGSSDNSLAICRRNSAVFRCGLASKFFELTTFALGKETTFIFPWSNVLEYPRRKTIPDAVVVEPILQFTTPIHHTQKFTTWPPNVAKLGCSKSVGGIKVIRVKQLHAFEIKQVVNEETAGH